MPNLECDSLKRSGVSFIIPAFNCEETIDDAVSSILNGNVSSEKDEVIIVDDASSDSTARILQDISRRSELVRVFRNEKNLGCPSSRNVGISHARNDILFNLDSDNVLAAGSVARLKSLILDGQADAATFGEIRYFTTSPDRITHRWVFNPGQVTLADFLAGLYNPGPSGNYMYTKESWQRAGKYDDFGGGLESWGFTLKLIASGCRMVPVPGTFYYHRHGHESLYVREAKDRIALGLLATRMITPYLHLIAPEDSEYILSEEGRHQWFHKFAWTPLRLASGATGSTGKVVSHQRARRLRNRLRICLDWLRGCVVRSAPRAG